MNQKFTLSNQVVSQIRNILQLSMLGKLDVTDLLRSMALCAEDSKLVLHEDYVEAFKNEISSLEERVVYLEDSNKNDEK